MMIHLKTTSANGSYQHFDATTRRNVGPMWQSKLELCKSTIRTLRDGAKDWRGSFLAITCMRANCAKCRPDEGEGIALTDEGEEMVSWVMHHCRSMGRQNNEGGRMISFVNIENNRRSFELARNYSVPGRHTGYVGSVGANTERQERALLARFLVREYMEFRDNPSGKRRLDPHLWPETSGGQDLKRNLVKQNLIFRRCRIAIAASAQIVDGSGPSSAFQACPCMEWGIGTSRKKAKTDGELDIVDARRLASLRNTPQENYDDAHLGLSPREPTAQMCIVCHSDNDDEHNSNGQQTPLGGRVNEPRNVDVGVPGARRSTRTSRPPQRFSSQTP